MRLAGTGVGEGQAESNLECSGLCLELLSLGLEEWHVDTHSVREVR